MVYWDRVTPGYFSAIGTQIIEGRSISEEDTATSQHVAVINEAFAKKYFNKENPIGQYFGRPELESPRLYKIVGVAQDARYLNFDFDKPIGPFFFLAEAQHDVVPKTGGDSNPGSHHLHDIILVTRPGATVSAAAIRQAIVSVDPRLPIESIGTLDRKSTRLNSSHGYISYAVFCLKKNTAHSEGAGGWRNQPGSSSRYGR